MNKWFEDTFLKSLFDKYGINNPKWLTEKQTGICRKEMQLSIYSRGVKEGIHYNYSYIWQGREVNLFFSKANNCGSITFRMNDNDKENHKLVIEREQFEYDKKRFERKPERLQREIEDYRALIEESETEEEKERYQKKLEYYLQF